MITLKDTAKIMVTNVPSLLKTVKAEQDDVIVAANMGRKAISDMLVTCKAAAYGSDTPELRQQAVQAGHDVAVQYRELLQLVMHVLNKPTMEAKQNLPTVSRKI